MDHVLLCASHIPAATSIPNTFIDKYMPEANGSYVKVYIFLSRCIQSGSSDISISYLADQTENTENDIIRALQYWEKKELIHISYGADSTDITGLEIVNPDDFSSPPQITNNAVAPSELSSSAEEISDEDLSSYTERNDSMDSASKHISIHIPPDQLKALSADESFTWTCHVIESYLDRPVKPNEVQLISYLYGTLKFSSDLLLYLYEYCISLGKTNVNYIQAVAFSWDEQNVKTPEDAQRITTNYNSGYTAISKAFALGRPLAMIEKRFVDHWQNDWKMDLSVILEACNRTMLKIQKADFKYTEGILDNWHKASIKTLQDIEKADEIFAQRKAEKKSKKQTINNNNNNQKKNQFQSFQQRGASQSEVDELEKKLLNR